MAFPIVLCGFALLVGAVPGQVVAPPAPQQNVGNEQKVALALVMEIREVNGRMEARFTNNTPDEVGVVLGKRGLRLKPGKSGTLAVPKVEELKIYDFGEEGKERKPRLRVAAMIAPQVGERQFLGPK